MPPCEASAFVESVSRSRNDNSSCVGVFVLSSTLTRSPGEMTMSRFANSSATSVDFDEDEDDSFLHMVIVFVVRSISSMRGVFLRMRLIFVMAKRCSCACGVACA